MIKKTPLCKLAEKYGADKCPKIGHMYTPFYYEYLKDKKHTFKKILEVGVGNHRQIKLIPNGVIGASIRMWRDFFPNAMVYGADIAPECIFEDERIKTFHCDELKEEEILNLVKNTGTDIDLVVDDACHHFHNQVFLFTHLMPLLKKEVIYIVEDCRRTRMMRKMFPQYNYFIPQFPPNDRFKTHDGVIIFTNK